MNMKKRRGSCRRTSGQVDQAKSGPFTSATRLVLRFLRSAAARSVKVNATVEETFLDLYETLL